MLAVFPRLKPRLGYLSLKRRTALCPISSSPGLTSPGSALVRPVRTRFLAERALQGGTGPRRSAPPLPPPLPRQHSRPRSSSPGDQMTPRHDPLPSRRAFLRFLAGSPLLSFAGLQACTIDREERSRSVRELTQLIASPDDALNVFDFEAVARNNLPPAHFGYMATGVDDDATLRANREGYSRLFVRPRRLVDVTRIDMSVELFGERWESPIVISPTGSQRAFHPQGELAVANAARTRNHLQILSTVTTTSVEDVTEARGAPVWYQL